MSPRPPAPRTAVRIRVELDGEVLAEGTFTETFVIGRDDDAGLRVDDLLVSRAHAEIAHQAGCWWVRDLDSANGTFVAGRRVVDLPIDGAAEIELGRGGPVAHVEEVETKPAAPPADASVTQFIGHYFAEAEGPSGERTQLIRDAYRRVHRSHRRRLRGLGIASLVLLAAALGVALWQRARVQEERARVAELQQLAGDLFSEMRAQDRQIALMRGYLGVESTAALDSMVAVAEAQGTTSVAEPPPGGWPGGRVRELDPLALAVTIREAEERRRAIEARYDNFVRELGVYRDATPREQVILRMARVFNESEFAVDAGFVREVEAYIEWWRSRNLGGTIARAERAGYTPVIAATMRNYGLPEEFFYLALVESHFNDQAVGPPTRWGIAKGMWQFIPSTALDYGLRPGPLQFEARYDSLDERFHFDKATVAAALYLRKLYTDLSQASGLLAMACYNWGEGRVLPRLRELRPLPEAEVRDSVQAEFAARFEGIAQDPQQRSYWRFLNTHRGRMPEETRNYVMRIFSAAVIGENPRLFGFNFDPPLAPYRPAAAPPPN